MKLTSQLGGFCSFTIESGNDSEDQPPAVCGTRKIKLSELRVSIGEFKQHSLQLKRHLGGV